MALANVIMGGQEQLVIFLLALMNALSMDFVKEENANVIWDTLVKIVQLEILFMENC